jgi:hypothetical protein
MNRQKLVVVTVVQGLVIAGMFSFGHWLGEKKQSDRSQRQGCFSPDAQFLAAKQRLQSAALTLDILGTESKALEAQRYLAAECVSAVDVIIHNEAHLEWSYPDDHSYLKKVLGTIDRWAEEGRLDIEDDVSFKEKIRVLRKRLGKNESQQCAALDREGRGGLDDK